MNPMKIPMRALSFIFSVQQGLTLVEILVGVLVGIFVSAIALVSLQVSQGLSLAVMEATHLQQDANTALRLMGQQVRQAGSIALNLQPVLNTGWENSAMEPVLWEVALEPDHAALSSGKPLEAVASPVIAKSTGSSLQLQYENYAENLYRAAGSSVWGSQQRDCLGQNSSDRSLVASISSTFFLRNDQLMCTGVAGTPQPIISNVKQFSVRFLLQRATKKGSNSYSFTYAEPKEMDRALLQWTDIHAVEVCLELESPRLRVPDVGAVYTNCQGEIKHKNDRLVFVAKSTFQIRSHGSH